MIDTSDLRRSARWLAGLVVVLQGALALGLLALLAWLANAPLAAGGWLAGAVGYPPGDGMQVWQAVALTGIAAVQLGLWIGVAGEMRGIFRALAWGDPTGAALAARRMARLLWIVLAWDIVGHAAATGLASWHYPDGTRAIGISLGSSQLSTALAALLAAFTARALALGAELWRDHREVI
ncbi:MAG: hypothetical protein AAF919_11150 [Pseudomonadota bacterium]